ncbi:iron-containing alcohol dehydrogenase [Frigidibacter sp. ROC022]|uniref:iron-containing alcohol dehydrogenase n=1 Tax=Frigidibacter sp. ROC022 TaxID=2971796 RepID=UPI00215B31AD|nr:iron-containing alcohol dehydrogenase [Frigidibacter sp. ROC022]MCR8725748.1 iron-containing alcohol dehydrogenase [Frigidibacter sp. ROC022]
MTLITYPTRVHFADDVLEDALHSELEGAGLKAPLLLGEAPLETSETCERVRSGFPKGMKAVSWGVAPDADLSESAKQVVAMVEGQGTDVVISFGSARAIELGRKVRRALSEVAGYRLPFYAVPGIDGLPDPCRSNLETWRTSLPTVLICDPTLTLAEGAEAGRQSAVMSLVRSTEAFLAETYNPPADGMALDAFRRCIGILPGIDATRMDIALHRDLMAAALNSAFSQDKGVGPTQVLTAALKDVLTGVDTVAAARLILPAVIEAMNPDRSKADVLGRLMGTTRLSAPDLRSLLRKRQGANGAARLSDLGLSHAHLEGAAAEAERRHILPDGLGRAVLEAVY